MSHTFKKAPSIYPFGFKRQCIKGKYFPRIKNYWNATTNKNRKEANRMNKLYNSNNL